jgi:hypothetical protein
VCGEGPSKNVLIQLTMFNKDRHTAKLLTFKNVFNTFIKQCNLSNWNTANYKKPDKSGIQSVKMSLMLV